MTFQERMDELEAMTNPNRKADLHHSKQGIPLNRLDQGPGQLVL